MVNYDPPYGFPLRRNGTCLSSETSCGRTWGNFHACCPGDSVCPGATQKIQNNVCCPSQADCTNPLKESPHCAVANQTMFNHTGYFCCLGGQTGFWTDDPMDAVGCSDGVPDARGYSILNPISYNVSDTATSTSSSLSTSSATTSATLSNSTRTSAPTAATSDPSDSSGGSSSNHAGAIAGGVVGGVAGVAIIAALVLFWLRRERKKKSVAPPVGGAGPVHQYHDIAPRELHGHCTPAELENIKNQQIHELPVER